MKSPDLVTTQNTSPVSQQQPKRSRSRWINFGLSLLVSALFLYLALRGIDLVQVGQELQIANYSWLVLALAIGVVGNLIRAMRWRVLLGLTPPPRLRYLFTSLLIGNLASNVLPARLGELVRVYVLERRTGISKSAALATIVLERLIDALLLLMLLGLLSFLLPLPALIRDSSRVAAVFFVAIAIWLLFLAFRGERLARLVGRLPALLSVHLGQRVQGIFERFLTGLSILRSRRQVLVVLLFTFIIWGIEVASIALVVKSLNLSLPWIAPVLVLVVLGLSFVIPAAPGAVGTYEFFAILALAPFTATHSQAVALALVLHAFGYITYTIQGVVCLWVESLSWRELVTGVQRR